jgi:3-oxoacyl-[acyl-carrier-protein] synthase-1
MNSELPSVYLHAPGLLCALGCDLPSVRDALFSGVSPGMRTSDAYSPGRALRLGMVDAVLPDTGSLPGMDRSRNNALLLAAFSQMEAAYCRAAARIPPTRIAIVIGTSNSGIFEGESAVRALQRNGVWPMGFHYSQQELGSPAQMLARYLRVEGPAYVVSTACTSSAKALISGARLLRANLADLVLAGGVDTLTRFTIAGFSALQALSPHACQPFSGNRDGINIGEAAALFMLRRDPAEDAPAICLAGWGESSDGYHVSAPDPQGMGAKLAIEASLKCARILADDVGYVNLHGTATRQNDAMESRIMADVFPDTPMSSTKPLTGHALGAAGALEAALCWIVLSDAAGRLPPHVFDGIPDPRDPPLRLVEPNASAPTPVRYALSTSFAFGGSNTALILGRENEGG